jgi:ribosomal protein L3 glutamine methyltransferase
MAESDDVNRNDIRQAADELITVRDWLRFSVSQFSVANLVYGHGTRCALDEAAFIILATLELPIDQLDPWLDARLTLSERRRVADVIARRIETRKPASYLTGEAWIGPYRFRVDERVIVPRSFIGELLISGSITPEEPVRRALDLCTGSGCLAILLAEAFPEAEVVASDISPDALEVARENVAEYGLAKQILLLQSDLFDALPEETFDLIVSNPPYVTIEAVGAFPPEYAAEPRLAHAGGSDGLDLVRRILKDAQKHISPGGLLVVEIGQAKAALEAAFPETAFQWLDTEESRGEVFMLQREELPG